MGEKAPQGGIRRNQFFVLSGGMHVTPNDIDVQVYKDHQATPDAVLSAEALGNLEEVETGVYRYSYSVSGLAAGTHLVEHILVQVTPSDTLKTWQMFDCLVEGVVSNTTSLTSANEISIRLEGKC